MSIRELAPYGPPPVPVEERTRLHHLQAAVDEIRELCGQRVAQNQAAGSKLIAPLISVEAVHTILKQHGLQ